MARNLGLHVQRGKLDAVETFFVAPAVASIPEGRAVKLSAADNVVAIALATDPVIGVKGGQNAAGVAVVRNGVIWMELAVGITPTLNGVVYIDKDGKATDVNTGTPIGYFKSDEIGANGIQNYPTRIENVRCAMVYVDLA